MRFPSFEITCDFETLQGKRIQNTMTSRPILEIPASDLKFLWICCIELGLGLSAIVFGLMVGLDPRVTIPALYDLPRILSGLAFGAAAGIALTVCMALLQKLPLKFIQDFNGQTVPQLMSILAGLSTPQIVVVALSAGVGEELLFRGWLMHGITGDLTTCPWPRLIAGLVVSSIVFGFAHPMNWLYVVLAALMGTAFGGIYWYTNNLLAPIAAHWIYDAIMIVWLMKSHSKNHISD